MEASRDSTTKIRPLPTAALHEGPEQVNELRFLLKSRLP